jgi:hypothetical protein
VHVEYGYGFTVLDESIVLGILTRSRASIPGVGLGWQAGQEVASESIGDVQAKRLAKRYLFSQEWRVQFCNIIIFDAN